MSRFDEQFQASGFRDLQYLHGDLVSIRLVSGQTITPTVIVEPEDELEDEHGILRVSRLSVTVSSSDYPTRRVGDRLTWQGDDFAWLGEQTHDAGCTTMVFEREESAQQGPGAGNRVRR